LGKHGLYAKKIQNGRDEVNKNVLLAQFFQMLIQAYDLLFLDHLETNFSFPSLGFVSDRPFLIFFKTFCSCVSKDECFDYPQLWVVLHVCLFFELGMCSLGQSKMNNFVLPILCDSIDNKIWIKHFRVNQTFVRQLTNKLKHRMDKEHKI
jgi:hypothetical protein